MNMGEVFDLILCIALVWLAGRALYLRVLFRSVVLFMAFGLLMAVSWARLGAPDVALAEAAIGAGITGALLLATCKALRSGNHSLREPGPAPRRHVFLTLAVVFCVVAGATLTWLTVGAAPYSTPVRDAVADQASTHFLRNPVTMVLLDLRAYDTLMEALVLLLASVGTRALSRQSDRAARFPSPTEEGPHTMALVILVTPLLLLIAMYLLWAGGHAPGGAFQAGALLAALGILYRLAGPLRATHEAGVVVRSLLPLGVAVFTLFAALGLAWSDTPLTYPEIGRYALALSIELALMLSVAVSIVVLFNVRPGLTLEISR
ncbi:MAG: hydrogenase subunit MbhD domain-containing protein [Chloroflexota bacterium]